MHAKQRPKKQVAKRTEQNNHRFLHKIAVTAIIIKDKKFLITRRAPLKKPFPGRWTVPGGKIEVSDYEAFPKDTKYHWYNVLEKVLQREVKEETGLSIDKIKYLTSISIIGSDSIPSLIISYVAQYKSGTIKLQKEETDAYAWVSLKEAKAYNLIEGIYDELVLAHSLAHSTI